MVECTASGDRCDGGEGMSRRFDHRILTPLKIAAMEVTTESM